MTIAMAENNDALEVDDDDDDDGGGIKDLFDIKTILHKVDSNSATKEPEIPTKSSSEILSELFGAFNAEPPELDNLTRSSEVKTNEKQIKKEANLHVKKSKKSKKKHKHKDKKHKKKSKSSKKEENSVNVLEDTKCKKKHRHSNGQKKKGSESSKVSNETSAENAKGAEIKREPLVPVLEPVSVKITTDNDSVKRTVKCITNENALGKEKNESEVITLESAVALKPTEESEVKNEDKSVESGSANATNAPAAGSESKPETEAQPSSAQQKKIAGKPGKIIIKNLKFSSVYEETVRQVEEQAKLRAELRAERFEEGEISDSSSDNKDPDPPVEEESQELLFHNSDIAPLDVQIPLPSEINITEKSSTPCKHSRRHNNTEEKEHRHHHHHHHHHHRHSTRSRSRSRSRSKSKEHSRKHEKSKSDEHRKKRDHSKNREHRTPERGNKVSHRSASRERNKKRNRSKSVENSKERNYSRARGRSKDHDHSKTSEHSKRRNHSKDREHSKGHDRKEKRSRSRSNSRRHRSRDRSSRDRSRKRSHSHESSSRSRKRSRRSHSPSRSKRRSASSSSSSAHIDKQKLLEIARKNAMNLLKQGALPSSVATQDKVVAIKAGGKSVAELTDFCKQLSKKEALGEDSSDSDKEERLSSGSDTEKPFHHPFQIKERPSSIVMNIRNSVQLPIKTLQEKTAEQSKQLRIQFPVSSGQQHRKTESEWIPVSPKKEEPVKAVEPKPPAAVHPGNQVFPTAVGMEDLDIGSIVSQRLTAMRKLQENPNDVQALSEMYRAQKDMQMWAESKQQPGQFTGSTGARVLSAAELSSGYQAWAKKDQLVSASPVSGGMGMTLLQKMGWRPGEGLGKNKEGTLEPLKLEIKMDKKGLVSQEELGRRPLPPQQIPVAMAPPLPPAIPPPASMTAKVLAGKHPVSLLVEFCSKRRWGVPQFELCFECGPDHKKNFLFKVRVNGVEYKPSVASPNKKQAKAEAATVCLQNLGVLPP